MPDTKFDALKMTKVYFRLRNARAELKREYDEQDKQLKSQMELIESAFHTHFSETNSRNLRTDAGIAFVQEDLKANISDWGAFCAWCKENDGFDMLHKRVSGSEVQKYAQLNDGELPAGVSVWRENKVVIRKG